MPYKILIFGACALYSWLIYINCIVYLARKERWLIKIRALVSYHLTSKLKSILPCVWYNLLSKFEWSKDPKLLPLTLLWLGRHQDMIVDHQNTVNSNLLKTWLMDWLVVLIVSRSRFVEEDSVTMVFTCPLLCCCKISSLFRENINVVVFPFPLHFFMPLTNLWFILLQG